MKEPATLGEEGGWNVVQDTYKKDPTRNILGLIRLQLVLGAGGRGWLLEEGGIVLTD